MGKIIFLIDGRRPFLKDFWINRYFLTKGFNYLFLGIDNLKQTDLDKRIRKPLLHLKYFLSSLNCILQSSRDDLIITWLDTMGVYAYLCSRLLFRRRKILILNLMIPYQVTFMSKIRDYFYRIALQDKDCYATVNNSVLSDIYNQNLNLSARSFFVLKDSINDIESIKEDYKPGENYVFFGGSAGRDFELMIEVARRLSNIPFVFVVKKQYFPVVNELPKNISIYFDISIEEFNVRLSNCSLLALPIKVDTPAGILVIITAGLKAKLVISSNTISIREYINNNKNGILLDTSSIEEWCKCIDENFKNEIMKEKLGRTLQKDIQSIISHDAYLKNLLSIINSIDNILKYKTSK